ncbi:MAG: aminotransferase class I/II-fold pyridoxal phosphate-dependent enzyme [Actinobacteria bacterium]|nr:aminotransferase class I/II-fold pyridoxal phosphate-dependent enzyme [Actinomycetota bacterium]
MRVVDLRSDTVTRPTPAMRKAMAEAEVGDDVFGEDPTTNSLQERVAKMCGKEAALFVPTGSMGNLVSLRALTVPGDEVICHDGAHFFHYEVSSLAAVAGVQTRPIAGNRGVLDPEGIVAAIRPPTYTFPRTRVISLENTHNLAGGAIYPIDDMRAARKVADEYGLSVHLDGARIFNASVATSVPVAEYAAVADTMTFCFSKGLGCPVGSMVVGSSELIEKAHRFRKMHGGGMRQVGVLTAACHVALDTMIERLADDHENAKRLAEGIAGIREGAVETDDVETNMVLVTTQPLGYDPKGFAEALAERGVKFLPYQAGTVRMVTHHDISASDIEYALEQISLSVS